MFSTQYVLDEILPLAVAAYPGGGPPPQNWQILGKIEPQDFGFVARNGSTVAISFCGTRTEDQWLHDFDALVVSNPYGPGRLHKGFFTEHSLVRASVWAILEKEGYEQLVIIGHSLGGPLANFMAADIAKNAPQFAARVIGYTFEGPKPGDSEFIADFNKKFPVWWRIHNIRDIIPTLPPPPIFTEHEGATVWIDGGYTMDIHTAHGLVTGVRPGLRQLLKENPGG